MMWWPQIVVMCTIYVCIASDEATDNARTLKDHVAELMPIDDAMCSTWDCIQAASWVLGNVNSNVDPCDDFYEFSCGQFGKNSNFSIKDASDMANDELQLRLKYIIEDIDEVESAKPFKLVKILYENCMNSDEIESSEGELYDYYYKLRDRFGWPVLTGPRWKGLRLSRHVILTSLLDVNLEPDVVRGRDLIPWIKLGRRVLDPEILRMGFDNQIVQAYHRYMVDIARILGADQAQAVEELGKALRTEIMLANVTLSAEDRWTHHDSYTRTTVSEFEAKYPKWLMREFISSHIPKGYPLTHYDTIMVPTKFADIEKVISETPKKVLANMIWWYHVESSAATKAEKLRDKIKEFKDSFQRYAKYSTKQQECIRTVRSHLGLSLSALYQRKYIDQKIRSYTNEMQKFIKQSISEIVQEATWLDREFKSDALEKVKDIIGHVSFRDEYEYDKGLELFYRNIELARGDVHKSIANISAFMPNTNSRNLRYFSSRDDWIVHGNIVSMFPSYDYGSNSYSVPAAFVLSDYFNLNRQDALNYATLGFHIAHEMSRSLDSKGIHIDKNGTLRSPWPLETTRNFSARVRCIIDQYKTYTVDEVGLKLRAYGNLASNIADNLAVKAAYRAFSKWATEHKTIKPNVMLAHKRLFWIGVGNAFCTKYENRELMKVVLAGDYSPAKFRINGALTNSPEFAKDFGCTLGSRMNPVKKCSVW